MPTSPGPKPNAVDAHSQQHRAIFERLFQGIGLLCAGNGISIRFDGKQYIITATNRAGRTNGTFQGEYDQTKAYGAGDTFIVSEDTTISGITVVAGYYGVPPAGTDAAGDWYGYVPANPTGNAVPQHPLPAISAAPNDKYYARLIVAYC